MEEANLSVVGKRLLNHIEFDQNEKLVWEIRKHPFGLFMIYLTGLMVAGLFFTVFVVGTWWLEGDPLQLGVELDRLKTTTVIIGTALSLFTLLITGVGAYLYKSNVVLVTNEKLAQELYKGLFDRKISQLSIGDVQDVTVNQKGLLARFFNYGTLIIETAGEQQNYTFTFAPKPYYCSQAIVGAHEENLRQFGN